MTKLHSVVIANGKDDLEIRLDNGVEKGWSVLTIIESRHVQNQFWIIFSKKDAE